MKSIVPATLLSAAALLPAGAIRASTFGDDIAFLRSHTPVIVLSDEAGRAEVAVAPAWQGRVMTSTAAGPGGMSFGYINRDLIAAGKSVPHMNAFGGEDRFWMGPEGGQFSLYFAPKAPFDLEHWYVPAPFDTMPYPVAKQTRSEVTFRAEFSLRNYSNTPFSVALDRTVRLLAPSRAWSILHVAPESRAEVVAYESENRVTNAGSEAWRNDTGLLSIWILGMFTPARRAVIVVPIQPGSEASLGRPVTSDYFGPIAPDRLKVTDRAIYLRADGESRGKIGISPRRSRGLLGAYDADHHVLTLVQFDHPAGVTDYVNSLWKIQPDPFAGDEENSYNDGPPSPGAKPLGPFFEMESSSPAAHLKPHESTTHIHRTIHLAGDVPTLDRVARAVLGVSLEEITSALPALRQP